MISEPRRAERQAIFDRIKTVGTSPVPAAHLCALITTGTVGEPSLLTSGLAAVKAILTTGETRLVPGVEAEAVR